MTQSTLEKLPFHNSNLFSAYYLSERLRDRSEWDCDEDAREALDEITDLYELEKDLLPNYKEDALIDSWIDEVLDILGYGTNVETTLPEGDGYVDVLLFEDTETRRDAAGVYLDTKDTTDLFEGGLSLLEAKQWDADFSKRFSENRPYYNASQQIRRYLDKTPSNIEWGILTNGRKWRLYGTKDHEAQIYYEVDLPELIEKGDLDRFKYFYLFFRPEAFRTTSESTFLDSVWSESETATQELGDDLQDNVFRALRVLGHGIVETNDLDIDPNDDDKLSELKEQSLVLLYRLMFVLYAESRQLIDPEGKQAQKEYEQNFSLNQHRLDIHDTIGEVDTGFEDEYSTYSTSIWNDLQDLFRLVDQGKESLGIPPYNGGLFDHEEHAYLTEHKVSDRYLAEVIYRLSTTENDEGRYVLADYGDLDTRHLGSVYEGLLEHQFRIAPEDYAAVAEDGGQVWKPATEVDTNAVETVDAGSLYVTNDEGERKATGAYYTPDYVVNYIVEETVGPLVDDIREDLVEQGFEMGTQEYLGAFLRRVTQLKILDPAMGSGHFLTGATGYLAEQVMKEVREVEVEMGVAFNEQHVRREIAKECIYGVDINGMAVELAKLSMWLETLAADRPLAFLDHHLKTGNSLVGSDITAVLADDGESEGGQLTLGQALARVRQQTLGHVMDLMQDLLAIDNERLEDIKSMEELYDEIRDDPLYGRLFEIANVHTAQQFGVDVPEDVYETMAGAVDDAEAWADIQHETWFNSAQALTAEQSFFHWELEYPEVFFNEDGEKMDEAGFDAVIGNPPYLLLQGTEHQEIMEALYPKIFTGTNDIAHFFMTKGVNILRNKGQMGYVVTRYWLESHHSNTLRKFISEEAPPTQIIDFGDLQIWPEINVLAVIGIFEKSNHKSMDVFRRDESTTAVEFLESVSSEKSVQPIEAETGLLDDKPWNLRALGAEKLWNKVRSQSVKLSDVADITQGIKSGNNDAFTITDQTLKSSSSLEQEPLIPLARSKDIRRYDVKTDRYVIYADNQFDINQYPGIRGHLNEYKNELENRSEAQEGRYPWWRLQRPHDRSLIESKNKVLVPHYARENRFAYTKEGVVGMTDTFLIVPSVEYDVEVLTALLNSSLFNAYMSVFGKQKRAGYLSFAANRLENIPVFDWDSHQSDEIQDSSVIDEYRNEICEREDGVIEDQTQDIYYNILSDLSKRISKKLERKKNLNLSLLDHLGAYDDGFSLSEIGLAQPPSGSAESILQQTATEKPNLRVGEVSVVRESETAVEICLSARYKPGEQDDLKESEFETDQWGYTETDLQPALRITDLTETEANLIAAFVPVAVTKSSGFAGFRETATKTNSLVDRLRKLTLPALSDVEAGLESYTQTKERAEELEARIEKIDTLIDEILYELYGLTDEEIEIVEETVAE